MVAFGIFFGLFPLAMYGSVEDLVAASRFGWAWVVFAPIAVPFMIAVGVCQAANILRWKGAGVVEDGEALVFVGPWDVRVPRSQIKDVVVSDNGRQVELVKFEGPNRRIGVILLRDRAEELRTKLLLALAGGGSRAASA